MSGVRRRDLLAWIATATGCAFVGDMQAFAAPRPRAGHGLSGADVRYLDQLAETILPRTDTPGAMDAEARQHERVRANGPGDGPPHYFSLHKQLALYGFFTSEPGETRVPRYRPVPAPYRGCVPYAGDEAAWSG